MTNFDYVELPKPKESGFDLSYSNKFTMDFGDMVPCFKQEILPGDELKVKSEFMVRFAPLANPIFTKIDAQVHYFFVPNRILWDGMNKDDNWETFITGGRDGSKTPTPPYITLGDIYRKQELDGQAGRHKGVQTLSDYMGVPFLTNGDNSEVPTAAEYIKINALPFLAYQKIYDDWFRDPNVTQSLFEDVFPWYKYGGSVYDNSQDYDDSGVDGFGNLLALRKRSWKKDYFTSALPWAQRGEEVHIPVNTTGYFTMEGENGLPNDESNGLIYYDGKYSLNSASLGTIRDLRNASALQLWLEKNAVGGARYIEQLLAHFGVYSDDARLQRAEYLGSVKSPVVISEIQSNAETSDAPLGKLGGKGISFGNDFAFSEKFKEHGWVIGIMTVMPEASYCQGIHRSLSHRNEKLDYAFPEFAELGLQAIDNTEIYFSSDSANEVENEFGYNDRYGEYKSNYNEVHGYFKVKEDTLSQYNMTRFFDNGRDITLSKEFLEVDEKQITSPFVDTESNTGNIWVDMYNDVKAIRPLPKNSLPLI